MKVTILGTNGLLSTTIAKYCNQWGIELNMYGRRPPTQNYCSAFYKTDFKTDKIDCTQLSQTDVIIYAIGAGIQSNLNDSAEAVYTLNVTVPVSICNCLKKVRYRGTFISFGSYFEIGERGSHCLFTEEDVLKSLSSAPNDYTVSKRMLTRFISSYKHDFVHWHFILPTIYGEAENPKRLIPYTVHAIRNNEQLHFTSGDQTRQYLYVKEVPLLLSSAFRNILPDGIYNIQGNETLTVKQIVTLIHQCLGKMLPEGCFGTEQRADEKMKYLALDGHKLESLTGFKANTELKDVILRY